MMRKTALRKREEEGTASVIGTLLAISILMSIISIIMTGYVPRWGEDKEAQHMKEVYAEFSRIKSNIDQQILDSKNTDGPSITMYSPISLGMQTVPIFTASSSGNLGVNERLASWTIGNDSVTSIMSSTGILSYTSNNIYFDNIGYIYENGGLIAEQGGAAVMKVAPSYDVYKQNDELYIDFTLISLLGVTDSFGGSDIAGIMTRCSAYGEDEYHHTTGQNYTLTMVSAYRDQWYDHFSASLLSENLVKGAGGDFTIAKSGADTLVIEFIDVMHVRLGFAAVKTWLE